MSKYFDTKSFNWSNLFLVELMFKLPINTLFTLRRLSSRTSDKEFREAFDGATAGLICQICFRVTRSLII